MTALTLLTLLGLLCGCLSGPVQQPSDASDVGLTTDQMILKHGYPCETHHVTTTDGYIVTLHRIPHGINDDGSAARPAVLLMHGILSSSADWVVMGPGHSLAYILADEGYDVWMLNARGNLYSRTHTSLDPIADKKEFFDFSWHEIGYYDVAESIDYILATNGDTSLYYVGHSQGTTVFFVLAGTRPEYNSKIRVASLLAPGAIMEHSAGIFQSFAANLDYVMLTMELYGFYEVPYTDLIRTWGALNCGFFLYSATCMEYLFVSAGGRDPDQIDQAMLPAIYSNAPAGAAFKQQYHYGQIIRDGGFSQYDYGAEENMIRYGTETPPPYDLSAISAPVAIYYGMNDDVVNHGDVQTLVGLLPNVVNNYQVSYELFNHIDFIYAKDVVYLAYDEVVADLAKY